MRQAFGSVLWVVAFSLFWTRGEGWIATGSSSTTPALRRVGNNDLRPVPAGKSPDFYSVPRAKRREGRKNCSVLTYVCCVLFCFTAEA